MSSNESGSVADTRGIVFLLFDHQLAALVILMIAGFGMTCNWLVTIFIRRLPSLQNPFGTLTGSQSLGEAIHLTVFTFFYVPMVFFDVQSMKSVSQHAGHILLFCYDICIYSHLFISLNRCCAIFRPIQYETIFSKTNTRILVVFSWMAAIIPSFYFYQYLDCKFFYVNTFWNFTFSDTEVCIFITWYTDFMKYVSIVIIIVVIDVVTVLRVHMFNKQMIASTNVQQKRKTNELNFLKQACLQAGVFVCELITYFILVGYVDNRWLKFFLTTAAWVTVHTSDGLITLMFNAEFRLLLTSKLHGGRMSSGAFTGAQALSTEHSATATVGTRN